MNGWVKLHRKIWEKGYSDRPAYMAVWIYLLTHANHKEKEFLFNGKIIRIKPGQLVTGTRAIAKKTGVPFSTVHRILELFENETQIETLVTNRYRIVTIKNWKKHQALDTPNETPVKRQRNASETPVKPNKKVKKEKKVKKGNTAEASSAPPPTKKKCAKCDLPVDPKKPKGSYCNDCTPMSVAQFVTWTQKSKQQHIRLIGQWADTVGDTLMQETCGQWKHYIKRNLRTARRLAPYSMQQLGAAYGRITEILTEMSKTGKKFDPGLETLEKQLVK